MNFRKLITYLTMGTAAAMPLAVAQNPTILQGSYISNVFGNSNFIKNPNAQTNIADVTVSNATVTRSTTTPLVATSEFLVTTSTATGSATWATRTFDSGMKGQNCEARFSYRGFSVGSTTAQILQGANVVAQLTLTASTDPRIASINFPCGDLSSATTFRLQQATASLTGTNEIGGIYVGLATNMANVAQAEEVGSVYIAPAGSCQWDRTGAGSNSFGNFSADPDCPTPIVTGAADTSAGKIPGAKFNNLKPGKYLFMVSYPVFKIGATNDYVATRMVDGTGNTSAAYMNYAPLSDVWMPATAIMQVEYTTVTSPTIQMQGKTETTTNTIRIYNDGANPGGFRLTAYRFPSSSELVVTPERQNVFGAVQWGQGGSFFKSVTGTTTPTNVNNTGFAFGTYFGKGEVVSNNNDYGLKVSNIPPGTYRVTAVLNVQNISGTYDCESQIWDGSSVIAASATDVQNAFYRQGMSNLSGVVKYTSFQASREFVVRVKPMNSGITCNAFQANSAQPIPSIVFEPLDQPSNSALYVQGPVQAAQTGAAIPAGYVGEVKRVRNAMTNAGATGAWKTTNSLTLEAGTWMCQTVSTFECLSMNCSDPLLALTGTVNGTNVVSIDGSLIGVYAFQTGWQYISQGTMPMPIRSNGSILTFPDGSTTPTNVLYSTHRITYPSGTPRYSGELMCIRSN